MELFIDYTPIINFLNLPIPLMIWRILVLFGWVPFVLIFLWGAKELWLFYIQNKWYGQQKKTFLAIDIPRGNEQSPRAVENIFSYLAGAHGSISLVEKYWLGKIQLSFSLEIVSIEGYTQFIIRTPVKYRDMVESAIYSQYPDAEITEINDYTEDTPSFFPDDEYDVFGTEFIEREHWVYPIKTYEEFEHNIGEETTIFKDPMATLMDLCSSLKQGEQLWFQIIIVPKGFDWMDEGEKEIGRILGEKPSPAGIDKITAKAMEWIESFSEFIYELWKDIEVSEKEDSVLSMLQLRPKQKKQVEGIQRKVSKIGFNTKLRMVYLARKEVINKAKVANGFTGFVKQFSDLDLNQLKPDTKVTGTKTHYFWKEERLNRRKNNIMTNFKARDAGAGRTPVILNTEELATLWHFPLASAVKAPLIQKAPGRKAEPPMGLPIGEEIVSEEILEPIFEEDNFSPRGITKTSEERMFGLEEEDFEEKKGPKLTPETNSGQNKKEKNQDIREVVSKGAPPSNLPFV